MGCSSFLFDTQKEFEVSEGKASVVEAKTIHDIMEIPDDQEFPENWIIKYDGPWEPEKGKVVGGAATFTAAAISIDALDGVNDSFFKIPV